MGNTTELLADMQAKILEMEMASDAARNLLQRQEKQLTRMHDREVFVYSLKSGDEDAKYGYGFTLESRICGGIINHYFRSSGTFGSLFEARTAAEKIIELLTIGVVIDSQYYKILIEKRSLRHYLEYFREDTSTLEPSILLATSGALCNSSTG